MKAPEVITGKPSEGALQRVEEELEAPVQERMAELLRSAIAARQRAEQELKGAQEELQKQSRELEEQIAERTAHLQATNKSLETLCYSLAHDLRAPNRAVQGFAELLLAEHADHLDPTGQEYLRRIVAAAARSDCLILDMLAYGRLGHAALPCSRQNLEGYLQIVLQVLASEIKAKKAAIHLRSPFPEVQANPMALETALINLLSNALKFVAEGVIPRITIWAEEMSESIRVCVQDNGLGIPPEHHQKIFKMFERLHPGENYPGTGIGLAIVQKAVERMGGRVGMNSQPGTGSCFWIELLKP